METKQTKSLKTKLWEIICFFALTNKAYHLNPFYFLFPTFKERLDLKLFFNFYYWRLKPPLLGFDPLTSHDWASKLYQVQQCIIFFIIFSFSLVNLNKQVNWSKFELPEIEFIQKQRRNCNSVKRMRSKLQETVEGLGRAVFMGKEWK